MWTSSEERCHLGMVGGRVHEQSVVRSRMIQTAETLFSSDGYRVTMLDIARAADAPRGSMYWHFRNGKADLAAEVTAKVSAELILHVKKLSARTGSSVEFLLKMAAVRRKRLVESDFTLGCALTGIVVASPREAPHVRDAAQASFDVWVTLTADALAENGIAASQARVLASSVISMIEGAIILARAAHNTDAFDALDITIPALVSAMATDPPSRG